MQLKIKLGPHALIGPGKIALLEAIQATGSISAASRATTMSYRKTRDLLEALNATFNAPVVMATKGGSKYGGTTLTPLGEMLVERYRDIEAASNRAAESALSDLLSSFISQASSD
ncbi:winged helix-turn-helix domain-containing protein [Trinickia terrae]|uniref:winged helix-turn-helix domain-containing protein n=1 Tax=Trinickia terrae TaxID=2571161 RepID=UPI00197E95E0|nr:LysR family transcriptional regulator [Trinickia terrae]